MTDFQDVRAFRQKFGFECPDRPRPLDATSLSARRHALLEEIVEYEEAYHIGSIVGVTDGLIDTVYFALGGALEMGAPERRFPQYLGTATTAICLPSLGFHRATLRRLRAGVAIFLSSMQLNELGLAAEALATIVEQCRMTANMMGIPWGPCWDAVHRANMRKVPGSTDRWEKDVIKPPDWIGPEAELRDILGV